MRPKPTREWVMLELERLQVRVVSGRPGRNKDDDDDDDDDDGSEPGAGNGTGTANNSPPPPIGSVLPGATEVGTGNGPKGKTNDEDSSPGDGIPPHRPLVGGGSAAAYEAARADHYSKMATQKKEKNNSTSESPAPNGAMNNADSLNLMKQLPQTAALSGLGGAAAAAPLPQLGLSVNPNQHYEMLKLHHMNLLNEIQETTLMMNLYQQQAQQQLSEQQQGLSGPSAEQQLALQLAQQQQQASSAPLLESMYGAGNGMNPLQQNSQAAGQLGLGLGGMNSNNQVQALLRQQNMLQGAGMAGLGQLGNNGGQESGFSQASLDQLREDLAKRNRADDSPNVGSNKRPKA
eukprot:CAMPEP_0178953172 /NCGR_PEP_ID=MMETSP0789-20121207/8269_1 /TAXON_ID=3005 /ORGANISM="Rhizosolenia setigera, Strain CCMP 1694" /LENGTH=346 /DNA_ID=CAMNT_0020634397 /DNA_START=766 /DNA_END=1806 /DNA_ORIENTATION=+